MSLEQPPPGHRASDNDRERAAAVVQEAHSDGRLDFEELDERLTQIYSAKTQLELRDATADLVQVRSGNAVEVTIRASHSAQKREGGWQVPERVGAAAEHSSLRLDFTDAVDRWPDVAVRAELQHSSMVRIVPPGWPVSIDDVERSHGSSSRPATAAAPNAVHLRVTGRAKHSSFDVPPA